MAIEHKTLANTANQHGPIWQTVANTAALTALTIAAGDVADRKIILQTDTGQLWVPTAVTPTFVEVVQGNDSRLSDARTPTSHGSTHTSIGSDPIPAAVAAGASGLLTGTDKTKLDSLTSGAAVASVSGTAPIVSSGGTTPAISITASSGAGAGSMSAADFSKLGLYPAVSGLTTGQCLRATGAATCAFGALDLANTSAVTGALPTANQAAQAMGGQCSGTTAACVNIAFTETGGPTALTFGAIPDGSVLKRVGSTCVGSTTLLIGMIVLPGGALNPAAASGASPGINIDGNDDMVCSFTNAAIGYALANIVLPADYNGGTITATFKWQAASASANPVVWGVAGRAFASGDATNGAPGTAIETTSANTGTSLENTVTSAAVTLAGAPAAGQRARIRIYRKASGADTLAATAALGTLTLTYTRQ